MWFFLSFSNESCVCRDWSQLAGAAVGTSPSSRTPWRYPECQQTEFSLYLIQSLVTSYSGFTTCIVTNNWLDDSDKRDILAQMMCELSQHFDFLIESCQVGMIKPESQIYKFVLDTLKAKPNEVSRYSLSGGKECSRDLAKREPLSSQTGVHLGLAAQS